MILTQATLETLPEEACFNIEAHMWQRKTKTVDEWESDSLAFLSDFYSNSSESSLCASDNALLEPEFEFSLDS